MITNLNILNIGQILEFFRVPAEDLLDFDFFYLEESDLSKAQKEEAVLDFRSRFRPSGEEVSVNHIRIDNLEQNIWTYSIINHYEYNAVMVNRYGY